MTNSRFEPLDGMQSEEFTVAGQVEAEAVELGQRLFTLDDAALTAFATALDRPPAASPGLKRLLETRGPWDR